MRITSRLLLPFLLFAGVILTVGTTTTVQAAELVMLEQKGCVYCQKWHEEIGPAFAKTEEGKLAPLRLVDINKSIPEDLGEIRIERFTPTFILVENGKELGRIRGYPGDEFFWFLLSEMLNKSGIAPS